MGNEEGGGGGGKCLTNASCLSFSFCSVVGGLDGIIYMQV